MSNGSNRPVNRHGIPFRGPGPERCIWPKCPEPVRVHPKTHLCVTHAELVHALVEEHREEFHREVDAMIARRVGERDVELPEPADPPANSDTGTIYYVQVGAHIKIGWASDLGKRLRTYPPNCQLLATHLGTKAEERKLHQRFAVHRSHGREWYPLVPVVLDHIRRVVEEHGKPAEAAFGAKPVTVPTPRQKQVVSMRARAKAGKRARHVS